MAFNNCVARKVSAGKITTQQAKRILAQYNGAFAQHQQQMGYTQAQIAAAEQVVREAAEAAASRRRVAQLQAAAVQRQLQRMQAHTNIMGKPDPAKYLQDVIANRRGTGSGSTLEGKFEAVRRGARAELTRAIVSFRANLVGMRRNKATLANVGRELRGQPTKDPYAAWIAKSWMAVAERLRTRFNAAGGHIGKLAGGWLPQSHNQRRVVKAGRDAWKAAILPRLDLAAMGVLFNNGVAFTPQTINQILDDAFEAIRTEGYSRRGPSANAGKAKYNARADHRFFLFKSYDDWMAYHEEFGNGKDVFRTMLAHLDSMAMDIAMMEELGPSPNHAFNFMKDAAVQMASRQSDPKALTKARSKVTVAEDMMDLFTGASAIPVNETAAKGSAALRAYLASAHLGSAALSALTDFNTQRVNARFIGLSQFGFMKQLVRLATVKGTSEDANDAGLIFENAVNIGNAVARYDMEDLHVETAARLADFTIRASGLGWLTEAQRQSFGLEFMNTAAKKWHGKDFGALPQKTQRMFQSYGIGPTDWSLIRRAHIHTTSNGLRLLRAQEIEAVGGSGLADRYMEAIASLTGFAVPTADVYGRAAVLGRTKPGTFPGELLRFGLQFKAFPVTILTTQFARIFAEVMQGRPGSAMSYAAEFFIGATILGALALQMKETAKGRDPRPMNTLSFWLAAAAQGGGAGIFGDFLFADQNRFGGGLAQTIAGPGISFMNDALRFTVGNAQQALAGDETDMGRETVDMMRRYTPGGSLWYLRAAWEREVLDRLQVLMDPAARNSFRAKERSAESFGTEYFYPPGSSAISGQDDVRAPDMGNALGN